jgi:hypothetical protein
MMREKLIKQLLEALFMMPDKAEGSPEEEGSESPELEAAEPKDGMKPDAASLDVIVADKPDMHENPFKKGRF